MPFLANVVRGKNVPEERLREVAAHYRALRRREPDRRRSAARWWRRCARSWSGTAMPLPVYWGNRNWHPLLADTLRQMADDGVDARARALHLGLRLLLGLPPVPRGHRAGPRRGRRARAAGRQAARLLQPPRLRRAARGAGGGGLRERARAAPRRGAPRLHRPQPAAGARGRLRLRGRAARDGGARGVSRSGARSTRSCTRAAAARPSQPWLEPDIVDHLRALAREGVRDVVVAPIGFLSDHMEVVYDLDLEAKARALELGLNMVRAATVGTHPRFVRDGPRARRRAHARARPLRPHLGTRGSAPDECPASCCLVPRSGA